MSSPVDLTYLADTVVTLRYFESQGAVKQAISVIKKRSGNHERTIREFNISNKGLNVGKPLTAFQGILSGIPVFSGTQSQLREVPLVSSGDGKLTER
jgi:circadian clock protein KaiC